MKIFNSVKNVLLFTTVLVVAGYVLPAISHAQTTPSVSLSLNPSTINNGGSYTITWTSQGISACAGTGLLAFETYLPASGTKTYTFGSAGPGLYPLGLSCQLPQGGGFGAGAQATLTVLGPKNTITLNPMEVTIGTGTPISPNFTVNWSSTNASSCTAIGGKYTDYATQTEKQLPSWSGSINTSGSKQLTIPFTIALVSSPISLGVRCADSNGVVADIFENLRINWKEGKPKAVTLTSPSSGVIASGSSQTINWTTTNLPSTLAGNIYLTPASGDTRGTATYYISQNNIKNNGSYTWDGKSYYNLTNSIACSQNGSGPECFTLASSNIPTGSYKVSIIFYADPNTVYDVNTLGQQIVDGSPANIAGMAAFLSGLTNSNSATSVGGADLATTISGTTPPTSPTSGSGLSSGAQCLGGTTTSGCIQNLPLTSRSPASETPDAPTVTLSAASSVVTIGDFVTLTWSSTNATRCSAYGSWYGAKNISGTEKLRVSLPGTRTYGLKCTGANGSATTKVQIKVEGRGSSLSPAAPATSTARSRLVKHGESREKFLRRGSRDTNDDGDVSNLQSFLKNEGYLETEPTGYYGNLTRLAVKKFQEDNDLPNTGNVGPMTWQKIRDTEQTDGGPQSRPVGKLPRITISANPTSGTVGGTTQISWEAKIATTCSVSSGAENTGSGTWAEGPKALSGNETTSPLLLPGAYKYTLRCSNTNGNAEKSVTVQVEGSGGGGGAGGGTTANTQLLQDDISRLQGLFSSGTWFKPKPSGCSGTLLDPLGLLCGGISIPDPFNILGGFSRIPDPFTILAVLSIPPNHIIDLTLLVAPIKQLANATDQIIDQWFPNIPSLLKQLATLPLRDPTQPGRHLAIMAEKEMLRRVFDTLSGYMTDDTKNLLSSIIDRIESTRISIEGPDPVVHVSTSRRVAKDGDTAIISWSAQYVDGETCVATGDWSGNKIASGGQYLTEPLYADTLYKYTLECPGTYGRKVSASARIGLIKQL